MNNNSRGNKPLVVSRNWHSHNRRGGSDREQTISIAIYSVRMTDLALLVSIDNRIPDFLIVLWSLNSIDALHWPWTRFGSSEWSADFSMATTNRTRLHVPGSCSALAENDGDDGSLVSSWIGLVVLRQTKECKTKMQEEKTRLDQHEYYSTFLSEIDALSIHRKRSHLVRTKRDPYVQLVSLPSSTFW